jgi:hypothetical protein
MAVPSSGQLRLYADIGTELGVAQSDVSLGTMSNSAGFTDPDAMSEFYGYVDALAPSVTTNNISNIAETSLTINGNITSDGGATITERGFYFGTNSSSPTNNTKYTVAGTTGYYSNNRTGLNSGTTYYCWAFATNSAGTTYGSRVEASTVAAWTQIGTQRSKLNPADFSEINGVTWWTPPAWNNSSIYATEWKLVATADSGAYSNEYWTNLYIQDYNGSTYNSNPPTTVSFSGWITSYINNPSNAFGGGYMAASTSSGNHVGSTINMTFTSPVRINVLRIQTGYTKVSGMTLYYR